MSSVVVFQGVFSVIAVVALYLAWRPLASRGLSRGRMLIVAVIAFAILGASQPRVEAPKDPPPSPPPIAEANPSMAGVSAQTLQEHFTKAGLRCGEGKQNSGVVSWTCQTDGADEWRVEFTGPSGSQIGFVTGSLTALAPINPATGAALARVVTESVFSDQATLADVQSWLTGQLGFSDWKALGAKDFRTARVSLSGGERFFNIDIRAIR